MNSFFTLTVLSIIWACSVRLATSFIITTTNLPRPTTTATVIKNDAQKKVCILYATQDIGRPPTFLDEKDDDDDIEGVTIRWLEEDEDDDDEDGMTTTASGEKNTSPGRQRWENLNPKIKQRLIEKGEAKAIANKKKREPKLDKKRRMMMYFKEKQREKKRASKIERPLGFDERLPLTAFIPGMEVTGVVISLTKFGAYVDVGTECDGLLHVSQITRDFFVEHPRQVLSPGDEVTVKVSKCSPQLKKMQLTMLNVKNEKEAEQDAMDRIPLEEIEIDDELWGELNRVTDFGAYIEVGAEVDGFLHYMDHPLWRDGMQPSEFMSAGQRVRVWVADVDQGQRRVRLTANRPQHLPGARRER